MAQKKKTCPECGNELTTASAESGLAHCSECQAIYRLKDMTRMA
jgi:ribosomal protein L37AE/L43A